MIDDGIKYSTSHTGSYGLDCPTAPFVPFDPFPMTPSAEFLKTDLFLVLLLEGVEVESRVPGVD
jgi:hypothetical protein